MSMLKDAQRMAELGNLDELFALLGTPAGATPMGQALIQGLMETAKQNQLRFRENYAEWISDDTSGWCE